MYGYHVSALLHCISVLIALYHCITNFSSFFGCFVVVTPHAQRERGKVIDRGVHIYMSVVEKNI